LADADDIKSAALENALGALPGVRRARVEADESGIRSIQVLVAPERGIEETVLDVRVTTAQEVGADVKPSRIQVLRMGPHGAGPRQGRRKLSSLTTQRSEHVFLARVALELSGDVLIGEADSPVGRPSEYHAVARAVIAGLGDLLGESSELVSVEMLEAGDTRMAIVSVSHGTDVLLGSAVQRYDEYDAIARATMDALNRVLVESTPTELAS
jgi:hypothetical protein